MVELLGFKGLKHFFCPIIIESCFQEYRLDIKVAKPVVSDQHVHHMKKGQKTK